MQKIFFSKSNFSLISFSKKNKFDYSSGQIWVEYTIEIKKKINFNDYNAASTAGEQQQLDTASSAVQQPYTTSDATRGLFPCTSPRTTATLLPQLEVAV